MFVCQVSGKLSSPGESPHRLITKTRSKTYVNKLKRNGKTIEVVSHGWEIVEEKLVCKEVYDRLQGETSHVANQSPVRTTYGERSDSSKFSKDQFQQRKKRFGRQGQKTNQVSGGQRTPKPVRAQRPNGNRRMPPVHKKPNS